MVTLEYVDDLRCENERCVDTRASSTDEGPAVDRGPAPAVPGRRGEGLRPPARGVGRPLGEGLRARLPCRPFGVRPRSGERAERRLRVLSGPLLGTPWAVFAMARAWAKTRSREEGEGRGAGERGQGEVRMVTR